MKQFSTEYVLKFLCFLYKKGNTFIERIKANIQREEIAKDCIADTSAVFLKTALVINGLNDKRRIIVGAGSYIRGELRILGHGGKIEIGENCYIGENTRIWSGADIKIGNRVLIGHNCNIFDNDTHPMQAEERHIQFLEIVKSGQPKVIDLNDKPITIEDDVWIGANVIIPRGGVVIGSGAVVAAGSVVTHNVSPRVVVAGNPAKIISVLNP